MIRVVHSAYCGVLSVLKDCDTPQEARSYVATRLMRYRKRFPVVTLDRGKEWEILEPSDTSLVPDSCGTLSLEHITYKCRECGSSHERRDDARQCCANYAHDNDTDSDIIVTVGG